MRADELNATHIGKRIRLKLDGSLVEDILAGVSHQASIINDSAMYQEHPTYVTGCRSTCITLLYFGSPQVPADPRARALWAKQQQGHGPAMTPLRVRGRTTHYKEKP